MAGPPRYEGEFDNMRDRPLGRRSSDMKFIALYKIGWRIFATTEVQAEVLAQKKASFDNPLLDVSEYRGIIGATKFTVPGPWQYNGGTAERAGENHGKE